MRGFKKGGSLAELFDDLIAPAMWEIGRQWESKKLDVFQEHLCTETLGEVLGQLRARANEFRMEPSVKHPPGTAIGCTIGDEHHDQTSAMIALVLNQIGWKARSIGAAVPLDSFMRAIVDFSPDVVWVSYTYIENPNAVIQHNRLLFDSLGPQQHLVLGGQALTATIRRQCKFHFVGDSLTHLLNYVNQLVIT